MGKTIIILLAFLSLFELINSDLVESMKGGIEECCSHVFRDDENNKRICVENFQKNVRDSFFLVLLDGKDENYVNEQGRKMGSVMLPTCEVMERNLKELATPEVISFAVVTGLGIFHPHEFEIFTDFLITQKEKIDEVLELGVYYWQSMKIGTPDYTDYLLKYEDVLVSDDYRNFYEQYLEIGTELTLVDGPESLQWCSTKRAIQIYIKYMIPLIFDSSRSFKAKMKQDVAACKFDRPVMYRVFDILEASYNYLHGIIVYLA